MKNSIRSVGDHAAAPAVVMVVEDEYFIRAMIADELRKSGFEVVECSSADEAMDVLNAGANPSVIFSDIRMPGSMDGVKLAQIVSEHFPDIRVVLTSSHAPRDGLVAEQFIAKPYHIDAVIQCIDALLGTSTPPDR